MVWVVKPQIVENSPQFRGPTRLSVVIFVCSNQSREVRRPGFEARRSSGSSINHFFALRLLRCIYHCCEDDDDDDDDGGGGDDDDDDDDDGDNVIKNNKCY